MATVSLTSTDLSCPLSSKKTSLWPALFRSPSASALMWRIFPLSSSTWEGRRTEIILQFEFCPAKAIKYRQQHLIKVSGARQTECLLLYFFLFTLSYWNMQCFSLLMVLWWLMYCHQYMLLLFRGQPNKLEFPMGIHVFHALEQQHTFWLVIGVINNTIVKHNTNFHNTRPWNWGSSMEFVMPNYTMMFLTF